ncbi:MAG: hypothetical protein P8166_13660 [Candidatus Thiodiazotropha sp.]
MSMLRVLRFVSVVFMVSMGSNVVFAKSIDMLINSVISDIQQRFVGEGQVVVVVSAGSNRPENEMLFFIDSENQERINLNRTLQARWLTSDEIIVQQSYKTISKTLGNRIIRVDRHGQLLELLSEQEGVTSPEFNKLALAAWVKSNRGYVPRIGVVSGASEGIQMINDDMSLNARPLFWEKEWVYGANDKGMFRCDAMEHGCEFIYAPGDGRRIVSGVSVGKDHALLLVQNLRRDPFETRATEIHKVDFSEGKKLDVLEFPEGVFIIDIDCD